MLTKETTCCFLDYLYSTLKQDTMMNLTIETTDKNRAGDVLNAYNIAMNEANIDSFISSLRSNIGASKVGIGGNHIWIQDTVSNNRLAIITNLFS